MKSLQISGLNIYPIKSCGGITLQDSFVDGKGLQYDRRWMLVDDQGVFITQRKFPKMALIKTRLKQDGIAVCAETMPELQIGFLETREEKSIVKVWDDLVESQIVSKTANEWFSRFLDRNIRLVYMPEKVIRPIDPQYAKGPHTTAFSDGFPILIISEASLDDLNSRLFEPVAMDRFRPNIVVSGVRAFEEDDWKTIRVGDILMEVVKPCARCVITTTDQQSAGRTKEPLATLAKYRTQNGKIMFGQNVIHQNMGIIHMGDKIEILKKC